MKKQPRNSKGRFARKVASKRKKGGVFHSVRDASGRFCKASQPAPKVASPKVAPASQPEQEQVVEKKVVVEKVVHSETIARDNDPAIAALKPKIAAASGIPESQITDQVVHIAPKSLTINGAEVTEGTFDLSDPSKIDSPKYGRIDTPKGQAVAIVSFVQNGQTVNVNW